jgi:hypothetical protein
LNEIVSPLLGQLQPAADRAGRLREDRRVRRARARPALRARPWKIVKLDRRARRERRQRLLRAVDLPLRGQVAAVLAESE